MKQSYQFVAIMQILFIVVFIGLTFLLFFPLQEQLANRIQILKYSIFETLEDSTGSTIDFSSIHPSIFGFIEIRDLRISDEGEENVFAVDRLIIYYKLGSLLRGDVLAAPRLLEVRGANLFLNPPFSSETLSPDQDPLWELERVLSSFSDELSAKIVNFTVRLQSEGLELQTLISRGRASLSQDSLTFSVVTVSQLGITASENKLDIFEIAGVSQVEGQVLLPEVLTFSEIRENSILQLYVSLVDVESSIVDLEQIDVYVGYANEVFTLQTLESDFLLEITHNIAIPLRLAEIGKPEFEQNVPPSLAIRFASSEWTPASVLTFRNDYQPYNYVLESNIDANITLGLSDTLFPLNSDARINIDTYIPSFSQVLSTGIQYTYKNGIFDLENTNIVTAGGDELQFTGTGNIPRQAFALSGRAQNSTLKLLPQFATDFFLDYEPNIAELYLSNSSILGAEIGETEIISDFESNSINTAIDTRLKSGNGSVQSFITISNLFDPRRAPAIDLNLSVIDILLAEVLEFVTVATDSPAVLLPEDLTQSLINGNVDTRIFPDISLSKQLEVAVNDFQIIDPTSGMVQLSLNAMYDRGLLQEANVGLHYLDQIVQVDARGNFVDPQRFALNFDTLLNSFPYSFELLIFPQRGEVSLTGSYQSSAELRRRGTQIDTNLSIGQFPVPVLGENAWLSGIVSAQIIPDKLFDSSINIDNLGLYRAELLPGAEESDFTMEASGSLNTGIQLRRLVYSDTVSMLLGTGTVFWDETLRMLRIETQLSNDLESYTADVSLSESSVFSTVNLENFTTRRLGIADITGLLNTQVIFSQSRQRDAVLTFDLQSVNTRLQNDRLNAFLSGSFQNGILTVSEGLFELSSLAMREITGTFNVEDGSLNAQTDLYLADLNRRKNLIQFIDLSVLLPEVPSLLGEGGENRLASYWRAIDGGITLTAADENEEAAEVREINLSEENGNLHITGGNGFAPRDLRGVLYQEGDFLLNLRDTLPVSFNAEGFFKEGIIDATLSNIIIQPGDIELTSDIFNLKNGTIVGSVRLQGSVIDPDFYGTVFAENLEGSVFVIPEPFLAPEAIAILEGQTVYFLESLVRTGEGSAELQGELALDKWAPVGLKLSIDTKESSVPIINDFNSVVLDGWGSGNVDLDVNLLTGGLDITGTIVANATNITISDREKRQQASAQANSVPINVDLRIETGSGVVFSWPTRDLPIFRSFAEHSNGIDILYSSVQRQYTVNGEIAFRGGEIFYFDQDFNIRQGSILFNENQQKRFDPLINLEAEFRGTDKGRPIRINLEVIDDTIFQMQPHFTSDPVRSQEEIVVLLGGAITGSEEGNSIELSSAIASGSQLLGQIRPLTDLENEVRQILGLDLLSFRIGVLETLLENAITDLASTESSPTGAVALADYLKNTTLLVGKYLGDDAFFEGSIRLQEQNPFTDPTDNQLGLKISPELRLELDTPIFDITWSWALLENPETLSVTEHRITFSRDISDLFQ